MNYVNQIKSIALGLILAFGISLAGATWTAPTASPTDNGAVSAPIDTSASDQAKAGTLSIASTAAATSPYKLDVLGYILSTGLAVAGGADIQGNIKSDTLASTGNTKVCADSAGVLTLCAGDTLSFIYTQGSGSIIIPNNVTAMTVEIWGGGGGSESRVTTSTNGGNTTFAGGAGVTGAPTITAYGGSKGTSSGGGSGGSYTATIGSKYSFITTTAGGSGTSGATASGHILYDINVCSSIYLGDTGGAGGAGGSSGGVSGPSGGSSGAYGSILGIICGSNSFNSGVYGGSGTTPTSYGVGGSGFGGTGGKSGDTLIGGSDANLIGENGRSGGGGAGYIKVDVNTVAGEAYNFSVGSAGQANNTWSGGGSAPGSWPIAGGGANGAVKITYTL